MTKKCPQCGKEFYRTLFQSEINGMPQIDRRGNPITTTLFAEKKDENDTSNRRDRMLCRCANCGHVHEKRDRVEINEK